MRPARHRLSLQRHISSQVDKAAASRSLTDTKLGQSKEGEGRTLAGGLMGQSGSFSPLKRIGSLPTEVDGLGTRVIHPGLSSKAFILGHFWEKGILRINTSAQAPSVAVRTRVPRRPSGSPLCAGAPSAAEERRGGRRRGLDTPTHRHTRLGMHGCRGEGLAGSRRRMLGLQGNLSIGTSPRRFTACFPSG